MQKQVSRRTFLHSGLGAALGACALGSLSTRAAAPSPSPAQLGRGAKMRLGLQTYLWGKDWDIPTILANLQEAQVYAVELRTSDHVAG